jgi:enhancing lycopene biosynthesis protein 2
VAARVFGTKFGGPGITLTLGQKGEKWPYNGSIDVASGFGNTLNDKINIDGVCVDENNKIYSTPAYMKEDAKPHEVFEGIDNMVKHIAKALKK